MNVKNCVKEEVVVKDCFDELKKALSEIYRIEKLLDKCYHIINENFGEYELKKYPEPYPKPYIKPNLRYGMTKLAVFVNHELLTIEHKVNQIIHSLVHEYPRLADSD